MVSRVELDPASHRRLQKDRSKARLVVQLAEKYLQEGERLPRRVLNRLDWAAECLQNHHGSCLPRLVAAAMSHGKASAKNGGASDSWKVVQSKTGRIRWKPEEVSNKSWFACGRGRCKEWKYMRDLTSTVCSCGCRLPKDILLASAFLGAKLDDRGADYQPWEDADATWAEAFLAKAKKTKEFWPEGAGTGKQSGRVLGAE